MSTWRFKFQSISSSFARFNSGRQARWALNSTKWACGFGIYWLPTEFREVPYDAFAELHEHHDLATGVSANHSLSVDSEAGPVEVSDESTSLASAALSLDESLIADSVSSSRW